MTWSKKMENSKHESRSLVNLKPIRICISDVHKILNYWKKTLTENTRNSQKLSYSNHHLIKSSQIHFSEKLVTLLSTGKRSTTYTHSQSSFKIISSNLKIYITNINQNFKIIAFLNNIYSLIYLFKLMSDILKQEFQFF